MVLRSCLFLFTKITNFITIIICSSACFSIGEPLRKNSSEMDETTPELKNVRNESDVRVCLIWLIVVQYQSSWLVGGVRLFGDVRLVGGRLLDDPGWLVAPGCLIAQTA